LLYAAAIASSLTGSLARPDWRVQRDFSFTLFPQLPHSTSIIIGVKTDFWLQVHAPSSSAIAPPCSSSLGSEEKWSTLKP
jgi:hypothetical protein